jgi:hypothetical protein
VEMTKPASLFSVTEVVPFDGTGARLQSGCELCGHCFLTLALLGKDRSREQLPRPAEVPTPHHRGSTTDKRPLVDPRFVGTAPRPHASVGSRFIGTATDPHMPDVPAEHGPDGSREHGVLQRGDSPNKLGPYGRGATYGAPVSAPQTDLDGSLRDVNGDG